MGWVVWRKRVKIAAQVEERKGKEWTLPLTAGALWRWTPGPSREPCARS